MQVASRKRQSKAVTIAYASLAGIILLVIAAIALVVVPPSPPSVAEFAPQAQEQIVDAPNQQSSQFGSGAGACAVGQVCEEGTAGRQAQGSRKIIEKARVRRCVGDPPRQIEDPQSPPCVNYFEGDNGGATSKGVTRDEIRIAWARYQTVMEPVVDTLVAFFNKRFEFYGRKIQLVKYSASGSPNPTAMRATAARVDEELGAFASFGYQGISFHSQPFFEELARRGVLGVDSNMTFSTEKEQYSPNRPYQWNYISSLDKYQKNQAEWFCKGFAGRAAGFAGPQFQATRRKVGILVVRTPGGTPDVSILGEEITKCTSNEVRIFEVNDNADDAEMTGIMAALRVSGTTSVTCYCNGTDLISFMDFATQGGYFPEWMLNPFYGQDDDVFGRGQPAEQRSHAFGLTVQNKLNKQQDSPWYWAATEMNPSYSSADYGSASTGASPSVYARPHYQTLLLLASAIQMAGPKLTPQTLEAGLLKTRFPNPGAGSAPYYQARVGFAQNDHTMIQDLAMIWFDESAESYGGHGVQTGRGSYCYVERGKRYGLGQWPSATPAYFDRTAPCK